MEKQRTGERRDSRPVALKRSAGMMGAVNTTARRTYDHRIRKAICASGNPSLFPDLEIPRSAAVSWIRRGSPDVVELDEAHRDLSRLQDRVAKLERRVKVLVAVVHLLTVLVRLSGFRFEWTRVADGVRKHAVLRAVQRASRALGLRAALRVLRMSPSRYHAWGRAETACELDDIVSCPRSRPSRLTPKETMRIKEMALDEAYRYLPVTRLALLAQRLGKVFASATTWARLIRDRGWRRPRVRVYPAKAKVGIQAARPNEYWHLDVTVVKLTGGTRAYVHGIIDNFSRKILAWRVAPRLEAATTRAILEEALKNLGRGDPDPKVVTDSGSENLNGTVDELLATTMLSRILALVDVSFSNSKIEAFWRSLRHSWLYLNELGSIAAVERLVAFYVDAHNSTPHSSFGGPTPDELYRGDADHVRVELLDARMEARAARLAENRALTCEACASEAAREQPPVDMVHGAGGRVA